MYDALDDLQASSAQWNYTATNRNDLAIGDGWNQEDLSIYSPDQHEDGAGLDSGGRAVDGFCRPYPRYVQGTITRYRFDRSTRSFELLFEADPAVPAPTVVYVPRLVYPEGFAVAVAGADDCDVITDGQLVQLTAPAARRLTLIISGM
jgi:hypothetical protein